jgi:hypothetical protein
MSSVASLKYPIFKGVSPLILKPIGRSYLGFSLRNEQILQEPKTATLACFHPAQSTHYAYKPFHSYQKSDGTAPQKNCRMG